MRYRRGGTTPSPRGTAAGPLSRCTRRCETVDEVSRAAESEAIGRGFRKGGTIALAQSAAREARARAEVASSQA